MPQPALPRLLSLFCTILLVAACSHGRQGPRPAQFQVQPISLAGEILGPPVANITAYKGLLAAWFDQADANHDGFLDAGEVTADTDRAFARMDRNGDGVITAADLTRYRAESPYRPAPEAPTPRAFGRSTVITAAQLEGADPTEGRKADALRIAVDPVMAADTDANFQVTAAELRALALHRFERMDRGHQGRVSRDAFLSWEAALLDGVPGW